MPHSSLSAGTILLFVNRLGALEVAMPTTSDLDLPIKKTRPEGPAVDRLRARKENNNSVPVTTADLIKRFDEKRSALVNGFKKLVG